MMHDRDQGSDDGDHFMMVLRRDEPAALIARSLAFAES
jgi:hypothetical protein